MTAPSSPRSRLGLAALVAGFHNGILLDLTEQTPNVRYTAALQLGIDSLRELGAAMAAAADVGDVDVDAVVLELDRRHQQLLGVHETSSSDGWTTTGLSWASYALRRVRAALTGTTSLEELGLLCPPGKPGPITSLTSARDVPAPAAGGG